MNIDELLISLHSWPAKKWVNMGVCVMSIYWKMQDPMPHSTCHGQDKAIRSHLSHPAAPTGCYSCCTHLHKAAALTKVCDSFPSSHSLCTQWDTNMSGKNSAKPMATCMQQTNFMLVKELCDTQASDPLLSHPANRVRTDITDVLSLSTASVALWNHSRHKCSKETIKKTISIPQAGTVLSFLSFFSRLVKRHLKLSDPCHSVKLTGKVPWSLSPWKSPGETPGHSLFPGFMLCLRNSFAKTKQFCANSQLWKHQILWNSQKKNPIIIYCFLSPSIAQNREHI